VLRFAAFGGFDPESRVQPGLLTPVGLGVAPVPLPQPAPPVSYGNDGRLPVAAPGL